MARPRRLRHKLMLGLALVVGSVALLLAGTLYGLNAYLGTVRTIERKLYELVYVNTIIVSITGQEQPGEQNINAEYNAFKGRVDDAGHWIGEYRGVLADSVKAGHDPDGGHDRVYLYAGRQWAGGPRHRVDQLPGRHT